MTYPCMTSPQYHVLHQMTYIYDVTTIAYATSDDVSIYDVTTIACAFTSDDISIYNVTIIYYETILSITIFNDSKILK